MATRTVCDQTPRSSHYEPAGVFCFHGALNNATIVWQGNDVAATKISPILTRVYFQEARLSEVELIHIIHHGLDRTTCSSM